MGIQSLLQLLQPATVDIHIKAYAGKRVAIDGYGWLHKGAYACAQALALGKESDA
jgi:exonuclease-1